uniref:Uncharacterized protein n=1 Tax=Nomascus leucogenys TaxID=61853 RepID=A0A2I3HGM7_NOMLE
MKVSLLTAALPKLAPKMEWAWSSRLALHPPHRHLPCPSHSSHGYMGPQLSCGFPPVCPAAVLPPMGALAEWRADVAFSVSCWGGDLHGGDKAVVATLGSSLRLKDAMRSLASPRVVPGQGQKGGMARDLRCPYSTVVLIPPHLPLLPARAPVV